MFMTSQLLTGMSFTILYIFTSELFPTYTRNSMQALCSSLGRIGGLIATQMPLLVSTYITEPMSAKFLKQIPLLVEANVPHT